MAEHNVTGKEGEEIAKKYLESKGYQIIEQNYKTKRAEIDIIARYKKELVFVEARTKHHELYGTPEETIDWKKRKKLQKNAQAYVYQKRYEGPYRIDAVCLVIGKNGLERINHYESIVET